VSCELLAQLGPHSGFPFPPLSLVLVIAAIVCLGLAAFRRWRGVALAVGSLAAVAAVASWRASGAEVPRYEPLSPRRVSLSGVSPGVELQAVPHDAQLPGPVRFTSGGDSILLIQYGEKRLCRYGLTPDAGTICAEPLDSPWGVAVNHAGTCVAIPTRDGLQLRSLPSLEPVSAVKAEDLRFSENLEFSPDDKHVVVARRGTVETVDLETSTVTSSVKRPDFGGEQLAVSGDGRRAAIGRAEKGVGGRWQAVVGVFSVADGRELGSFARACGGWYRNISLDETGQTLAWAEPAGVQIFNLETGELWAELPAGIEGSVPLLSPDGRRVAIDGDVLGIWDARTGRQLLQFAPDAGHGPMGFSADGNRLAVVGQRSIRILEVPR
jgi:hypothetical protein